MLRPPRRSWIAWRLCCESPFTRGTAGAMLGRAAGVSGGVMPGGGQFWSERKVAWYRRALERSDYARTVLGVLAPVLEDCETALDVGAGCGALALPLAGRLGHVTALEPAPAMARALREAARGRDLRNIDVVEAAWGEVSLPRHDLVLCAHAGPLVHPRSSFPREASALARRWVALVRDTGEPQDKFFFQELYPLVLGRPYESTGQGDPTAGLGDLGRPLTVSIVTYRSDQPLDDLEEACDFWQEYLGVDSGEVRPVLREFLAGRLVPDGRGWIAPYSKKAAVIYWPTARAE